MSPRYEYVWGFFIMSLVPVDLLRTNYVLIERAQDEPCGQRLYHFSTALLLIDVVHYITIALPCIKSIQNAAKMNAKDKQALAISAGFYI